MKRLADVAQCSEGGNGCLCITAGKLIRNRTPGYKPGKQPGAFEVYSRIKHRLEQTSGSPCVKSEKVLGGRRKRNPA